jgi:hypothetical protein
MFTHHFPESLKVLLKCRVSRVADYPRVTHCEGSNAANDMDQFQLYHWLATVECPYLLKHRRPDLHRSLLEICWGVRTFVTPVFGVTAEFILSVDFNSSKI